MRNHIEPPIHEPKSIVSRLVLADGSSYGFRLRGRWLWMWFWAPDGKVFAENGRRHIQEFHWARHFHVSRECEFLAKAFKLMAKGYHDDPTTEQPT